MSGGGGGPPEVAVRGGRGGRGSAAGHGWRRQAVRPASAVGARRSSSSSRPCRLTVGISDHRGRKPCECSRARKLALPPSMLVHNNLEPNLRLWHFSFLTRFYLRTTSSKHGNVKTYGFHEGIRIPYQKPAIFRCATLLDVSRLVDIFNHKFVSKSEINLHVAKQAICTATVNL